MTIDREQRKLFIVQQYGLHADWPQLKLIDLWIVPSVRGLWRSRASHLPLIHTGRVPLQHSRYNSIDPDLEKL